MNFLLGREGGLDGRAHLAGCKKCQKRVKQLELKIEEESFEMQSQSAGFKLSRPRTPKPVDKKNQKTG